MPASAQAAAHVARRRVVARQLFAVLMLAVLAMLLAILPGGGSPSRPSPTDADAGGQRATPFSPRKGRRTMKHTRVVHALHGAPPQPPQARRPPPPPWCTERSRAHATRQELVRSAQGNAAQEDASPHDPDPSSPTPASMKEV